MPNVLALFDDAKQVERAQAALEDAGAADDVVRVFLAPEPTTELDESASARDAEANVVSQQGEVAAVGAPTGSAADLDLDALGEVGQYFWRAHQEGAHLMVLDVADPQDAAQRLDDAGAQRVHVS